MQRRWTAWIIALAATGGLGSCAGTIAGQYTVTGLSPMAQLGTFGDPLPRLRVAGAPEVPPDSVTAPSYFVSEPTAPGDSGADRLYWDASVD